jgi:ribosomal protein L24
LGKSGVVCEVLTHVSKVWVEGEDLLV